MLPFRIKLWPEQPTKPDTDEGAAWASSPSTDASKLSDSGASGRRYLVCLGKSDPVTTVLLKLAVSLVATDLLRGVYPGDGLGTEGLGAKIYLSCRGNVGSGEVELSAAFCALATAHSAAISSSGLMITRRPPK